MIENIAKVLQYLNQDENKDEDTESELTVAYEWVSDDTWGWVAKIVDIVDHGGRESRYNMYSDVIDEYLVIVSASAEDALMQLDNLCARIIADMEGGRIR